jgi:hypothetical protein
VGGILLIIGFLLYGGGRAALGDFTLQYARTVSAMDNAQRQQQDWADHARGYLDTVLFVVAGAIICVMGILVHIISA